MASDGGIFGFGDALFYGSTGDITLNAPVVGMAPTADGGGYYLAASDGGVFAYGDAAFAGSAGGHPLAMPVTGIAPTPSGSGYCLAASDGGVFAYGNATFHGSSPARHWPPRSPASRPRPTVAATGSPPAAGHLQPG